jgi:hypothetical protein
MRIAGSLSFLLSQYYEIELSRENRICYSLIIHILKGEPMVSLIALWLPILLSAVIVFIVSSIIHMVSPWHKSDYPKVPNEDTLMDAVRPLNIPPGDYMVPRPSGREGMRAPEFIDKLKKGPVMILTVLPSGQTSMGMNLVLWFLYSVVIGFCAAYVAGRTLSLNVNSLQVFRLTGVTAFMGYSVALWQMSIWYRRAWSITMKATVDGLIYAVLTAGIFVWLWPY